MPIKKSSEDLVFKPNIWSYILLGSFDIAFSLFLVCVLVLSIFVFGAYPILYIIPWLVLYICLRFSWSYKCYEKEEYIIKDNKIVYHYGSIISDNSVEINLDKIVQVYTILGFIQNSFFRTGTILLKTAGSSSSRLKLKNIDNPLEMYELIQEKMKLNGFHLTKDKLVQSTKPHPIGVILELINKLVWTLFMLFVCGGSMLFSLSTTTSPRVQMLSMLAGFVLLAIVVLIAVFSYLDLKRRRYDIYTDGVFYTEGFLTKVYSFLPMESVADTENKQDLLSRLFGIYDVIVSSEGANTKVVFKNMQDGEDMMNNIKLLKNSIIRKAVVEDNDDEIDEIIGYKDKIEKPLDYDKKFTGEYQMSMLKAVIVSLPFFILGYIGLIVLVLQIIRVVATKYYVNSSSIDSTYEFLNKKRNSFSIEKITGVIISESFLDKWLGTCSITFWSIGASYSIHFSGIKKPENIEKNILAKVGIRLEEEYEDIKIDFSFGNYIKRSIWVLIIMLFSIIINILLWIIDSYVGIIYLSINAVFIMYYIGSYFYSIFLYDKKRYLQRIHSNFIESVRGIFFVRKSYSLFRHIKGVKGMQYPMVETGTITLDVAGEQLTQQGKNGPQLIGNKIIIPYVSRVHNKQNEFDEILKEEKLTNVLDKTSRQDVSNSISWFILLTIICTLPTLLISPWVFLITLLLFVVVVILLVWYIREKYYNIERDRVVSNYGIIFKTKHTILKEKINFIEKNEGPLNKIFKNGTVKVYTIGSGRVEMYLSDMDNYVEIYNLLKKN